ncbi:hypothetical protein GLOTRDRAFT_132228 [Gloeophyllum trabeum ATCC 11539]|uniref:Aminoglycoside phosphotransferase domain-containing protein n=1 Tax=Gloeophyllum trabeum (strain ATCC 11539 / FP-39264 / Madison 617) TaxID=670483 RepID=S7RHN4_GLOTA|nr:uncharacterized protein GLOTRDRAFT_132228 [Gloeophyllum trabeum ATCC 11539]EPQ52109.1 hypothetical protein GLOTRDRAFT_132228 [Gloeophyllum trabeum ATCC 11539]
MQEQWYWSDHIHTELGNGCLATVWPLKSKEVTEYSPNGLRDCRAELSRASSDNVPYFARRDSCGPIRHTPAVDRAALKKVISTSIPDMILGIAELKSLVAGNSSGDWEALICCKNPRKKYYVTIRPHVSSNTVSMLLDVAGGYSMLSEFSTLREVAKNYRIPVPRAVEYGDGISDGVHAEWIVRGNIPGSRLSEVWNYLDGAQRSAVCVSIGKLRAALLSRKFQRIGRIWTINEECKVGLGSLEVSQSGLNRIGQYEDAKEWLIAIAMRKLPCYGHCARLSGTQRAQVGAVMSRIRTCEALRDKRYAPLRCFALEHVDLHPDNVLVKPDQPDAITGVLSWDCARVVPVFAMDFDFFDRPDFGPAERLNDFILAATALRVPDLGLLLGSKPHRQLHHLYHLALHSHDWHDLRMPLEG